MRRRTSLGTTGRLLALGLGLGAAATVLASRSLAVAGEALSPVARVEEWVELVVVAGAALAAAWVALGAMLGLAVVVSARAGAHWHAGEVMVRTFAPGLVRRLVRAGIGVGVGTGLALTPTAAMAAAPAASPAVVGVESTGAAAVDLGVAVAEPAAGAGSGDTVPAGASGGIDLSWRPTSTVAETRTSAVAGAEVSAAAETGAPASTEAAAPTTTVTDHEPVEGPQPSTARAHGSQSAPAASGPAGASATPGRATALGDMAAAPKKESPAPRDRTTTQRPIDRSAAPVPADQSVTDPPVGQPSTAHPADSSGTASAGQPVQPGHASATTTLPTPSPAGGPATSTPGATPATSDSVSRPDSPGIQNGGTVVVLRGDTLWDLAARWLGGEPTDAQVMAATVRWHEANRDVIGDDADVILPGQILTPPA